MKRNHWAIITLFVSCCLALLYAQGLFVKAQTAPPPLDSPLPTPSPTPLSPEAEIALRYIADREGIAVEQLEVIGEESITFHFLAKNYTYITLLHLYQETSQLYSLLVDPITKAIEPDYNAIKALDHAAQFDRHGKLNIALYDRLQQLSDEEEVLVAIWLAHSAAERTGDEIYAAVIARYPEAGKALAEGGVLWDVADPQLSVAIQVEFERLVTENTVLRSQALIAWLQADGLSPETISGMPVVQVKLPKRLILTVAQREDVARIDAADGVVEPAVAGAP